MENKKNSNSVIRERRLSKSEYEIVKEFTQILGLENQTDGTLFIYKKPNINKTVSLKPDGYYYQDGVTFILDAKSYNVHMDIILGQLLYNILFL